MMIVLGITGGIGSGKTTITDILSLLGFPVYVADTESKRLTEASPVIREKLTTLFGDELYQNKKLNKPLLASHIFNDKTKLQQVNAIIHPEVEKDLKNWIQKNKENKVLAVESAILFESRFDSFVDKTITVYTPLEERIKRTIKRDNSSRNEVLHRINSQMPDEKKKELSDFVIVNDNSCSLIEQITSILKALNVY